MKQLIKTLLLLFFTIQAFSQSGSISGKITDTSYKKPQGYATITVFKALDTSIVTYRLSTPEGEFKIPGLPLNIPLRFLVSYSGFNTYRKDFMLTPETSQLRFDSVALVGANSDLMEVVVTAERPPVMIKKDTIEFNATAFKTLPNALVEDLLKKLPGVQVDRDGNIMVNGKPVNRILVDGKSFFGDDPKMATRNLPANVIEKVQVMDDKEELLRNGDDNLNNVGKVVNITLKKGVKKGWFGKMYAGAGTTGRYEAGGIANIYRDTFQVSVLGYMNNLNKPGFGYTEMMQAGGFDRTRGSSNSNSTSVWVNGNGSGLSINGINFGGSQSYGGISTSKGAGFNLNHSPNAKRSFYGQYFYGTVNIDRISESDVKQFYGDTVINNSTLLNGGIVNHGHNFGVGAKFKPDSLTNIFINASYTLGLGNEDRFSNVSSLNNKLGQLSVGNIIQNNQSTLGIYRQGFSLSHMSGTKKGRRYSISHNLDHNNRTTDFITESVTNVMYPAAGNKTISQLRKDHIPRTDASLGFNYTEPISKKLNLRVNSRYEYGRNKSDITTFNKNSFEEYTILNSALSSQLNRISNRINSSAGLEFKWKDFAVTPGIRALWQNNNTSALFLKEPLKQDLFNLLPALNIVYKKLNVNYDRGIVLPGYNYLIAVTDNTNPYFITKGNPDLLPSTRDNISVNWYFNDTKKSMNFGLNGAVTFSKNDVIQSIILDNNGVQTTTPVNADGSTNFWLNYNLNRQYKNNQKFIFSWNTGAYYQLNRSPLLFNAESSWQNTWNLQQWNGVRLNWDDKFEWNMDYSIGFNFTRYSSARFKNLDVTTHDFSNEFVLRYPKHVIWETKINYSYNGNIGGGLPKDQLRWNAGINFTMLKDEVGVLSLSVFDILKRNRNISANVNRNMITTTKGNVLAQYFMATFTYNIRAAGMKKKVGGSRLLMF
ncbi:MAG: TonB-dependent receptor [Bacteroidota bacterium]